MLHFLMSPLIVPAIVIGASLYMSFVEFEVLTGLPVVGSVWGLAIGHVLITIPWSLRLITANLIGVDRSVEEAARIAGATRFATFAKVVFPLSLPGLSVGVTLVFSLTAAAYVMPQMLGGSFSPLLGTLIEQQIMSLSDWPFGSAISGLLIVMVLAVNLILLRFLNKRFSRWTAGAR